MIILDTNVLSGVMRPEGPPTVVEWLDAQVVAVTRQHAATLATRNVRDFDGLGLDLIDPWSVAT